MLKPALLLYRVGLARVARLQRAPVLGDTKRLRATSCMAEPSDAASLHVACANRGSLPLNLFQNPKSGTRGRKEVVMRMVDCLRQCITHTMLQGDPEHYQNAMRIVARESHGECNKSIGARRVYM